MQFSSLNTYSGWSFIISLYLHFLNLYFFKYNAE